MRTKVLSRAESAQAAAAYICDYAADNPGALVGLDCSPSLQPVYNALGQAMREGLFRPETLRFCTVREIAGTDYLAKKLEAQLDTAGLGKPELLAITDENAECYDGLLREAGGIGLILLTVEEKGRIGFNEPSSAFDTESRSVLATERIRKELDRDYPEGHPEAAQVLTMGIRTITRAKNTVVAAYGAERADAVYRMLYGRDDSVVPAAFLQLNAEVLVLPDEAAASLLGKDRLIV